MTTPRFGIIHDDHQQQSNLQKLPEAPNHNPKASATGRSRSELVTQYLPQGKQSPQDPAPAIAALEFQSSAK